MSFEARFWKKVDIREPDECWGWQAQRTRKGYGRFDLHGRHQRANRVAWRLTHGPVPPGLCVLHKCDNPPCCNPRHLWLGTVKDNNADMARKGRHNFQIHPRLCPRGEQVHCAKLTQADVEMIRFASSTGRFSHRDIATCYAVNRRTVDRIVRGELWAHIPQATNRK